MKRQLKARPLNLHDAFRLAYILSKYIDKDSLDKADSSDAIEFISEIVNKISPSEYIKCVELLTGLDENIIKKEVSLNILSCFIEGLKLNQVVTLVSFYKSMVL